MWVIRVMVGQVGEWLGKATGCSAVGQAAGACQGRQAAQAGEERTEKR